MKVKKIMLFIFSFLSIILCLNLDVMASEFYPIGLNYFDSENFWYLPLDEYNGNIKSISNIKVKGGHNYCIGNRNFDLIEFKDYEIKEYDEDMNYINDVIPDICEGYKYTFLLNEDTYYISVNIKVYSDKGFQSSLNDYLIIDTNDISYENFCENFKLFEGYDTSLVDEITDLYSITSKLSSPLTIDNILSKIKCIDNTDGDISKNIKIIDSNYDYTKNEIGSYSILLSCTNSNNITTNIEIIVNVIDDVYPNLNCLSTYFVNNTDHLSLEEILKDVTANDNVDGDLTNNINIERNEYLGNEKIEGKYLVTLSVCDSSNNKTIKNVYIDVNQNDHTAPVIYGETLFETTINNELSLDDIFLDYEAFDDFCGDLSDRIEVVLNEYEYNKNKRGEYKIDIKVEDYYNNIAYKTIIIKVYDYSKPKFYIETVNFYVPLKGKMKTTDELLKTLEKFNYLEKDYIVITNEYEENKNAQGNYLLTVEQDDEIIDFIINVSNDVEYLNIINDKKLNIIDRINRTFNKFFNWVRSIFKK